MSPDISADVEGDGSFWYHQGIFLLPQDVVLYSEHVNLDFLRIVANDGHSSSYSTWSLLVPEHDW